MVNETCAVINPYALVEQIAGKPIAWSRIDDPTDYLEGVLGQSIENLVDPEKSSLLYPRVAIQADGTVRMLGLAEARQRIAQLAFDPAARSRGLAALGGQLQLTASQVATRLHADDAAVRATLMQSMDDDVTSGTPWTPTDKEWFDKGHFFNEATQFSDPVQGHLGDCYFIAALSAVAWASPEVIVDRNRTLGPSAESFVDVVRFNKDGAWHNVQASERVPVTKAGHDWVYARSSDDDEIWPAVYEKLFAKWRTGNTTDQPPYAPIAGGSPYEATRELTGRAKFSYPSTASTADQLWTHLRARCATSTGGATVPLTACTYASGDKSPDHVVYAELNLVACHAYTVLGSTAMGTGTKRKRYVILRNPWGYHGAIGATALTTGSWNGVPLGTGGVFGLQIETFKRYYSSFGGVA